MRQVDVLAAIGAGAPPAFPGFGGRLLTAAPSGTPWLFLLILIVGMLLALIVSAAVLGTRTGRLPQKSISLAVRFLPEVQRASRAREWRQDVAEMMDATSSHPIRRFTELSTFSVSLLWRARSIAAELSGEQVASAVSKSAAAEAATKASTSSCVPCAEATSSGTRRKRLWFLAIGSLAQIAALFLAGFGIHTFSQQTDPWYDQANWPISLAVRIPIDAHEEKDVVIYFLDSRGDVTIRDARGLPLSDADMEDLEDPLSIYEALGLPRPSRDLDTWIQIVTGDSIARWLEAFRFNRNAMAENEANPVERGPFDSPPSYVWPSDLPKPSENRAEAGAGVQGVGIGLELVAGLIMGCATPVAFRGLASEWNFFRSGRLRRREFAPRASDTTTA